MSRDEAEVAYARRRRPGLVAAGAAVQGALLLAWLVGWPVRWLAYSKSLSDDVSFYTNWNWTMTGLFFLVGLPGLLCAPWWDTALHLLAFTTIVFSNVLTFVGGTLVIAENRALLDSHAHWFVLFVGERFVHVLICLWVLVYAVLRANDLKWMWKAHAYGALRACGCGCGAGAIAALVAAQLALPFLPLALYTALFDYGERYGASLASLGVSVALALLVTAGFLGYVLLSRPRALRAET
jgi:hypothetical protein